MGVIVLRTMTVLYIPTRCLFLGLLLVAGIALASVAPPSNIAVTWNDAALRGARDSRLPAPEISRALAVVNTCIYDAWAAFDSHADGTQLKDVLRRPLPERTERSKREAISYAAYRALEDVLPVDTRAVYTPLFTSLGFDPNDHTTDLSTPRGIGNVACAAVLAYRHRDGSNQLGDLHPGPYTDWTGYVPKNRPTVIPVSTISADPNHWQPLTFLNGAGERVTQTFAGAQWGKVIPFAIRNGDEFRDDVARLGPALVGSQEYKKQADEIIALSANLTDRQKTIAEFWADGVDSEQPAGHWLRIGEWVSARDHHTLDDDVKFFFVLSNALFDAGIAAWDAKAAYDSVRPVSAISALYRGQTIKAWKGPGKGTVEMDGALWRPYQKAASPTPPFPEFVSGHSTYSATAAMILQAWTGSDIYGGVARITAGSSEIEPGITPREPITLQWRTFSEAAEEAGMSRRYGGIHFRAGDEAGRLLGQKVAKEAWITAQSYFSGHPTLPRILSAAEYASLGK
jgi:hypothetical protein